MFQKIYRNPWKSAGLFTLILIGLAWLALTLGISAAPQQSISELDAFTTSWEEKGETIDLNTFFPPQSSDSKKLDFHQHPAFLEETEKLTHNLLNSLEKVKIQGLSHRFYLTGTFLDGESTSPGFITNIDQWLDPPVSGLTEKETAQRILKLISPLNTRLQPLVEASKRPEARYPRPIGDYENNFSIVKLESSLSNHLLNRAILHIIAGETAKAFDDIETMIRISKHSESNHCLLGYVSTCVLYSTLSVAIHIALELHAFSPEQLATLATQLNESDHQLAMAQAIRGEIAFMCTKFHKLLKSPQSHLIHDYLPEIREVAHHILYWNSTRTDTLTPEQIQWLREAPSTEEENTITMTINASLLIITETRLMRTAIDLERYRLIHQDSPAKLSDLVPEFASYLPIDLYTSKPLLYQHTPKSTPLLYSTGIDQVDHGGNDTHDLLWKAPQPYPPPPPAGNNKPHKQTHNPSISTSHISRSKTEVSTIL